MILVELDNGTRREFNSSSELAEAIGRGELGSSARIYHHLREQWLPITRHPEFQRRGGNGDRPLPPLERTRWTFFSVEPEEAHRLATTELRRPGSAEAAETVAHAPAAALEAPPAPRWHQAIGSAMRRLRPKSTS